jgi:hypothetical protein
MGNGVTKYVEPVHGEHSMRARAEQLSLAQSSVELRSISVTVHELGSYHDDARIGAHRCARSNLQRAQLSEPDRTWCVRGT